MARRVGLATLTALVATTASLVACADLLPGTGGQTGSGVTPKAYQIADTPAIADLPALSTATGYVVTLAGRSVANFTDANGKRAGFASPMGLVDDGSGNLYVADTGNHAIRFVSPAGDVLTLAGNGIAGAHDGPMAQATFRFPTSLALDSTGYLIIADSGNNKIRAISPAGAVITLAGDGLAGWVDGAGATSRFFAPRGLCVDLQNNIYVADSLNHAIRMVTPAGVVSTLAGTGQPGYVDGPGGQAQFNEPWGIAVDDAGLLYVADTGNHCIRTIALDGTVATLSGGITRYKDGYGTEAGLGLPAGIAVERGITNPYVYVSDLAEECVRRVAANGETITVAGSLTTGMADGWGSEAKLNAAHGLAMMASGSLAIADSNNHLIRRLDLYFGP